MSDVLKQIFQRLDMTDAVQEIEVKRVYKGVVGELIAKLTKEVRFQDGVLTVKLLSPALKNELGYKKQGLIDAINERLSAPAVKQIILK